MPTDAITAHLGIPKPDPANDVDYDFTRLILSMEMIDGFIHSLQTALAGVAASDHGHVVADVEGLQAALDTLAGEISNMPGTLEGLSDTDVSDATQGMVLQYLNSKWTSVVAKASYFGIDAINGLDANNVQAALEKLTTKVTNGVAPGCVAYYAMSTAPDGWLKANGAEISRTAYADLFAAIGTIFGVGDGNSTFNLPDLRGEFLRGWDDARGVDGARVLGSSQSDQNASHTHTGSTSSDSHSHTGTTNTTGNHTHNMAYEGGTNAGTGLAAPATSRSNTSPGPTVNYSGNHSHTFSTSSDSHSHSVTTDASGGSEARPRNIALLACIKY
ncbi:putative tail fiber-related protein [Stappia aggregata IAM 12614]|uniref:Putative tail fiber-related protein n=1 Tax=Roseibium aggregatum (strain ATCC 25650 / DSM 13394 / JCM 20685 / NBRC 16684 / NCIMB 2208 / IAM 12614 / B1) TaxID=384765 RepID=A0NQ95_ROSAI|nr:phage tail protein [Roseibium aggregatum]EAV44953.1 putative tail fiber-related protein [Stappia aggregata IAM 12614] [Roseibium aggregatum IAM 12614]